MSCYSLPGIRRIQYVLCSDLDPSLMLQSISGGVVVVSAEPTDVEFSGIPTLQWEGSIVNGTRQEKSTLEFSTIHPLPEGVNLAFIITGANGQQFLIGTKESRYPVINYSQKTGEPGKSAAVRAYKITHLAQKSVLPCIL